MAHVSRAGRKAQIFKMLSAFPRRNYVKRWSVGDVAKRLGLKSSTHLKNILREMCNEYDEISIEETESGDYFHFTPYRQADFFDRMVTINGQPISIRDQVDRLFAS